MSVIPARVIMVAFLQIVCFAGIFIKLGDLMSMFSLNAGDSQSMGRRIFRRPYLFMRHRARRMEHRIARAVSAGGISGGVAGAVAGSAVAGKRAERKNTASKEKRVICGNVIKHTGNTERHCYNERYSCPCHYGIDRKSVV